VNAGGVDHTAGSVGAAAGGVLVQFNLSNSVPVGTQVPVTVSHAGATSQPVTIPVR
jgi:hypothetical protein